MKDSRHSTGRVHRLYRLLVTSGMSFEETCLAVLREGAGALGASYGHLSRTDGTAETIICMYPAGASRPAYRTSDVKQTFCPEGPGIREAGGTGPADAPCHFQDTGGDPERNTQRHFFALPETGKALRGTVLFSSENSRHRFSADDHEYVRLLADGICALFERKFREDEKENALQVLIKNNDILESIFRNATIGMALVRPSGQWMKVNRSLVRMLGYSEEYLLSVTFQTITHPDDLDNDLQQLDALSQGLIPSYQLEKRYLTAAGEWIWILLSVSLVREDNGEVRYYIAQIQSIDEQKKMALALENQKESLRRANILLEQIAAEDSLTGVASRRQFMRWFDDAVAQLPQYPAPLSLVIADIDFFKIYNDSFGHPEGDTALRVVARTLSDSLRQRDRLARFGGEEFIILLPETDEHACFKVCERLRKQTEEITTLRKTVTLSLGAVTWWPEDGKPVVFAELLRVADGKLYEAKRAGRNCVRVSRL
ncbi:sensor domain-containing diguanylate cyclase [Salmonella enterica subsp. enterica serovar Newport]|nr:sensor domain-containing diguanylate cyclase [Salmonella enterica subsp. enterica serovar Newport]MJR82396.1 sensor domain-containing diguanylate cyclase [Salmonella enterica subsp. enterica serovar Newport]